MANVSDGKILGVVPKDKYVQITYTLVLVSSVINLCGFLLLLSGGALVFTGIGGIGAISGIAALIMAIVGYFGFKDEFAALDQNHLLFLCVAFAVLFIMGAILNSALYFVFVLWALFMLVFNVVQLLVIWGGFNAYRHGRSVTLSKDGIVDEMKRGLSRS